MSSKGFELPLRLNLQPSRMALALDAGSALLAIVAVLSSSLPTAWALCLTVGLLAALALRLRRNGWLGVDRRRIIALQAQTPKHWRAWRADGVAVDADHAETVWRFAGITVLRLTQQSQRLAVLALFSDSAPADSLRRLRVLLKFTPSSQP